MFQRPIRTRLPEPQRPAADDSDIREHDKSKKEAMKSNAEKHHQFRESNIKVGDTVLVKHNHHVGKLNTPFDIRPLKVVRVRGSRVTAQRGSYFITWNVSHFKVLTGQHDIPNDIDNYDDDGVPSHANIHPRRQCTVLRLLLDGTVKPRSRHCCAGYMCVSLFTAQCTQSMCVQLQYSQYMVASQTIVWCRYNIV